MTIKNSYTELPEIDYARTTIDMNVVAAYLRGLAGGYSREIMVMALAVFINESANGKKGVNNNYAGIQADCGRWTGLKGAVATCVRMDSGGVLRRFICFSDDGYQRTIDLLLFACKRRGMYIGAPGVKDVNALGVAYLQRWVGRKALVAEPTFKTLYNAANKLLV